jgi:nucleoside phosphorylase
MEITSIICWKLIYALDRHSVEKLPTLFNYQTGNGFIRTWGGMANFEFSPQTLSPTRRFYDLLSRVKEDLGFSERKFPFLLICEETGIPQKLYASFRIYGDTVLAVSLELHSFSWSQDVRLRDFVDIEKHQNINKLSSMILGLIVKGESGFKRAPKQPRIYSCVQIKQSGSRVVDEVELVEALTGHIQPTSLVLDSVLNKNSQLQIDASTIYIDRQGVVSSVPEMYWSDHTVGRRFVAACNMLESLASIRMLKDKGSIFELSALQRQAISSMVTDPRQRFAHSVSSFHMWSLLCSEFKVESSDFASCAPDSLREIMKKILIVTALDTEAAPFIHRFPGSTTKKLGEHYVTVSSHIVASATANIYIFTIDIGNTAAALNAQSIVNTLKPDLVLFSGIAGGRKDAKIGDVVIANHVYSYESAKETKDGLIPRPREIRLSGSMRSLVNAFLTQLRREDLGFGVYFKPIACGEKLIASDAGMSAQLIAESYSDSYAIEMEGYGFLSAMHESKVDGILIRGVSDLLNNKQQSENHEIAITNSAELCFRLIDFYLSVE